MSKIGKTCPKCKGTNITENSPMNPIQDLTRGKDLKFDKYPKYLCEDCSKEFNE
jgi:predicted nucleic-acid-binding Zn-ribbon protein